MNKSDPHVGNLLSHLSDQANKGIPPVETWDPPYCGEIDIIIKANGDWFHNQTPIARIRLSKLFSTILLKKDKEFFLVTPVEKLKIKVEWQPFVIVDFDIIEIENIPFYQFVDNCQNQITLTSPEQLKKSEFGGQSLPIINVRKNLYASFNRNCYYRLIEQADIKLEGAIQKVQINSAGLDFNLGEFTA